MNSAFQSVLEYLYGLLPMYQRIGSPAIKKSLDNTIRFCALLGNPQEKFDSIHVGGTNGKGSCSHMIASVLQSAGYHTGLYTSPHLKRFTERIKVDGAEVEEDYIVQFVEQYRKEIESIQPSFFELTVAMAFDYFAQQEVDIAVIEVGLGGRLDSTNIIHPLVSLITNIGYEHMDMLGDTLPEIAYEKGGIIKPNTPVVIGEYQQEVEQVFRNQSNERNAKIYFASEVLRCERVDSNHHFETYHVYEGENLMLGDLRSDLIGLYQARNIPGVIKTLDLLPVEKYPITEKELRKGLSTVKHSTGLKGRWQLLQTDPMVFCDVAHNENGIEQLLLNLHSVPYRKLYVLLGMVQGKDERKVLRQLPKNAFYYFCEANIPRKLPAERLLACAIEHDLKGEVIKNVNEALQRALGNASTEDCILITGSNFLIGELENL